MDVIPGSVLFLLAWAAFPLALGMIIPVMLASLELSIGLLAISSLLSLSAAMKAISHRPDARLTPPFLEVSISIILLILSWWSPIILILAIISAIICFHAAFRVCDRIHRTEREVRVLEWNSSQQIPVSELQRDGWSVISGNWRTGLMATKGDDSLLGGVIDSNSVLISTIGVITVIEEE